MVKNDGSAITEWAQAALGNPEVRLQVRLRGNHLHILCEASQCPEMDATVAQFSVALAQGNLAALLPPKSPRVYQIFLCGRAAGHRRPDWTVRLDSHSPSRSPRTPKGAPDISRAPTTLPPEVGPADVPSMPVAEAASLPYSLEPERILQATMNDPEVRVNESAIGVATEDLPPTVDPLSYSPLEDIKRRLSLSESLLDLSDAALVVSYERLARRGYPDAIASYLSEILGALGVEVKVMIRDGQHKDIQAQEAHLDEDFVTLQSKSLRRLLALLEASYSPDPSLLADPITQRLRDLNLKDFRDAVILLQVRGETSPDWMLRIDLTPPDLMLKEWARWGDVAAINRLLNQELARIGVEVRASLKKSTLHLFCRQADREPPEVAAVKQPKVILPPVPDKQLVRQVIEPLLNTLAPQGVLAATLYGVKLGADRKTEEAPVWIDWLDLPAVKHPDLAPTPQLLAAQGDVSALSFLLDRLINPDLDQKLATGGIRVLVLPKGELLHIMSEAPTCPSQSQIGPPIAKFLKQLNIPQIKGVRVYGRRAGQKVPLWRYGVDFTALKRSEAEAAPEFAASDSEAWRLAVLSDEELMAQTGALALRPEFPTDDVEGDIKRFKRYRWDRQIWQRLSLGVQQALIASNVFVPQEELESVGTATHHPLQAMTTAIVWGILGGLLTWQVDQVMGRFLQEQAQSAAIHQTAVCQGPACQTPTEIPTTAEVSPSPTPPVWETPEAAATAEAASSETPKPESSDPHGTFALTDNASGIANPASSLKVSSTFQINPEVFSTPESTSNLALNPLPHEATEKTAAGVFNPSGFTKASDRSVTLEQHPEASARRRVAEKKVHPPLPPLIKYPSFSSQQLDEQLVRYQEYIQREKRVPDILIVGSSRALRGIDPTRLEEALAKQGHPGMKVYNLGVNGATIQVVDLVLRQILPVEELPKLIVLADGVRAINGGRVDATFNAMAASEGYQQVMAGGFKTQIQTAEEQPKVKFPNVFASWTQQYKALHQAIEDKLTAASLTYEYRSQLKTALQSVVSAATPFTIRTDSTNALIATMAQKSQESLSTANANASQLTPEIPPTGNKEQNAVALENNELNQFEANGFLPISIKFDPETYYQKYTKVSGYYDNDYAAFQLSGVQIDALKNLLGFTQHHNISVVFINMPLTEDYLDPVRLAYEQEFSQQMNQLATQLTGFTFLDFSRLWPLAHENFSDPSHLNRYGAAAVSERLAEDTLIPWPKHSP